jgi:exodeoxyribonuclease I
MNSIFWHDYETTGVMPAWDRPLQFAGIRTDEDLNIVGEPVNVYCQPSGDILPHPEACLVTGITPQLALEKGHPEPEFMARVHAELAQPGTCGAGYNSIRFDDEVTRYGLYRNFFDPYEREWQSGNSRWDIIDMVRLTYALRPEGIEWPRGDDGMPSFRLELLTEANGISHEAAHDAMSDVYATIAMAKLVKSRQPRLYDYVFQSRRKARVLQLLDLDERKPFLHVSSRLPRENSYAALMIPLCRHPRNNNAVIAFNLSSNPEQILTLSSEEITQRLFTPTGDLPEGQERIGLKGIHVNRCPVVATPKLLDNASARRLGIDVALCETHWQQLRNADIASKIQAVFDSAPEADNEDVEAALYSGFIPAEDKPLLSKVRRAPAQEMAVLQTRFRDPRYRELLFRYRARFYPDSLSEDEALVWEEQRYARLSEPSPGRLTLDEYFARIGELSAQCNDRDREILDRLREWGDLIIAQ